jgi:dihydrolipoamide dehydrogenase
MLSNSTAIDVVVIGAGPGGYTAADRVAQLEGKILLVEKDRLGGNCLNRGCIPAVALLRSAQIFSLVKTAKQFGVHLNDTSIDYESILRRKDELVGNLVAGTERRLMSSGVELVKGKGTLAAPGHIEILRDNGQSETIEAKNIIIATGSKPLQYGIPNSSNEGMLLAEEALALKRLPRSMAFIGCDYVGVQLACIFNRLGAEVTIVESDPRLLPDEDEEIGGLLQELLTAYGIRIMVETRATKISMGTNFEKKLTLTTKDGVKDISVEEAVLSKGRTSNTDGLGLEKVGVATNGSGGIIVDKHMRTNVPNIYAVGDSVGRFMLAQVAMAEGTIAAENAMGKQSEIDYRVLPKCIFTLPEIATVGLTERQAKEQGHKVKVSRLPLELNGFAHIIGQTEGMIKIISDSKFGEILGMQIIGAQAVDLINEAALAIRLEATAEDMAKIIRVHPSLAEAVRDAAWRLHSPVL